MMIKLNKKGDSGSLLILLIIAGLLFWGWKSGWLIPFVNDVLHTNLTNTTCEGLGYFTNVVSGQTCNAITVSGLSCYECTAACAYTSSTCPTWSTCSANSQYCTAANCNSIMKQCGSTCVSTYCGDGCCGGVETEAWCPDCAITPCTTVADCPAGGLIMTCPSTHVCTAGFIGSLTIG